jgi:DNA-binding IscR family transcriptional regulator
LTVEYREKTKPQVNKKIQNIFARLRKSKTKSVDETDAVSTVGGNAMQNEIPERIILAERKQIVQKIDEISDAIKEYLEEQQLADLSEEKLNEFLKELVAAYIP